MNTYVEKEGRYLLVRVLGMAGNEVRHLDGANVQEANSLFERICQQGIKLGKVVHYYDNNNAAKIFDFNYITANPATKFKTRGKAKAAKAR